MFRKVQMKRFFSQESAMIVLTVSVIIISEIYTIYYEPKISRAPASPYISKLSRIIKNRESLVSDWIQEDRQIQKTHFTTEDLIQNFKRLDKYLIENPNDINGIVERMALSQNILFEWIDESPSEDNSISVRLRQEKNWADEIQNIKFAVDGTTPVGQKN